MSMAVCNPMYTKWCSVAWIISPGVSSTNSYCPTDLHTPTKLSYFPTECSFLRSTHAEISNYVYVEFNTGFDLIANVWSSNMTSRNTPYQERYQISDMVYQKIQQNGVEHTVTPAFGMNITMNTGSGQITFEILLDMFALNSGAVIPEWAPAYDECDPAHIWLEGGVAVETGALCDMVYSPAAGAGPTAAWGRMV
eukprot:GHVS01088828.1.p1 GENE.GHVS01088828.1~~GHVS01088828.1.p1  ORF type:complete len:195 (-),score=8.21 GHVS01088828.1:398-982(-)